MSSQPCHSLLLLLLPPCYCLCQVSDKDPIGEALGDKATTEAAVKAAMGGWGSDFLHPLFHCMSVFASVLKRRPTI